MTALRVGFLGDSYRKTFVHPTISTLFSKTEVGRRTTSISSIMAEDTVVWYWNFSIRDVPPPPPPPPRLPSYMGRRCESRRSSDQQIIIHLGKSSSELLISVVFNQILMGPVRIRHSSHDFGWQSSQSVDLAGWQAKMASIEIWIPWRNAHKPHWML